MNRREILDKLKLEFSYCSDTAITIHGDGSVSAGSVIRRNPGINDKISVKFNKAMAFKCSETGLTTLINSPKMVDTYFLCMNNIKSLIGGPTCVGTYYDCRFNLLTSLEGLPEYIGTYLVLDIHDELPLLRILLVRSSTSPDTLSIKNGTFGMSKTTQTNILSKFRTILGSGKITTKQALWECSQSLINEGFDENARW
jgi:hypothetical protein